VSRHHGPHDFTAGEEVTVVSGNAMRTIYPGKVDRVTRTQVHVTYDASRTAGRPAIKKTFWGASGQEVGGFGGGSRLAKRKAEDNFA
jgi:hypothetical protein